MNHADDSPVKLDVLRQLPLEVDLEQVRRMVAGFPLAMGTLAWLIHTLKFHLNTVLMSTLGTLIVTATLVWQAGPHATVEAPAAPEPRTEQTASSLTGETVRPGAVPTKPLPATAVPAAAPSGGPEPAPAPPAWAAPPASGTPGSASEPEPSPAPAFQMPAAPQATTGSERVFDLRGFTGITLLGSMNAVVEQGDFAVRATGAPRDLDLLDIRRDGHSLAIGTVKQRKVRFSGEVLVHVTLPELKQLTINGSGDIKASGTGTTTSLELHVLGSGDILLTGPRQTGQFTVTVSGSGEVNVEGVAVSGTSKISMLGSGDVQVAGSTDRLELSLSGSGDADVRGLSIAKGGQVTTMGSGDVLLNSTVPLTVVTMGSGRVRNTAGQAPNADGNGED